MLKVEIRDDVAVFDELATWWNAQPGPQESVFLRSEWFRTLAPTVVGPAESLQVFVIRDGEDPVAALPMYRSGRKLRSLTELSTETFDLIHQGDPRPIERLVSELNRHTMVRLEAVPDSSPLAVTANRNRRWHIDNRTDLATIDLEPGLDSLLANLGRNMRSNLSRGRRALEEMGQVVMEAHPTADRVDGVLSEGLALESAGWKGRSDHSIMSSKMRLSFFTELAAMAQANDWLRLGALYVDGHMVAFQYDLEYAGRQVLLLTCYDESLSRASPGNVLLWKTLEAGVERGVRTYELGSIGGRKAWKLRWTSATSPRVYIAAFGSNPPGRIANVAWLERSRLRELRSRRVPAVA